MDELSQKCRDLLEKNGMNLDSEIDFDVNGVIYTLSFEYIIDSYMSASQESRVAFLAALQMALSSNDNGVSRFFEGMGKLLLMTHLSKNIETT